MSQAQSAQYNSTIGAAVNVGSVVSSMVKVAVVEVAFPHESVAVKVTIAVPVSPHPSVRQPAV